MNHSDPRSNPLPPHFRAFHASCHHQTWDFRPHRSYCMPRLSLSHRAAAMSSPSEEIPLPNLEETWATSTVTKKDLLKMVDDGVLPAVDVIEWCATSGKRFPTA